MPAAFSGEPRAIWLTDGANPDRKMKLIDPFWFDDPAGRRWDAPAGSVVDGASIPQPLWTLVGSPYTGDYRRASIVHDIACDLAVGDDGARREADRMFFHACRQGGCSVRQSIILYVGVRIGSNWNDVPAWSAASRASSAPRTARTPADKRVEADFQLAAEQVLAQGEVDDIDIIEQRTDVALAEAAGFPLRR